MIEKLYKFKKVSVDQVIAQKQRLLNQVYSIEEEIINNKNQIISKDVDKNGQISSFTFLINHKNALMNKIKELKQEKTKLLEYIKKLDEQIVKLNQECEQYEYILKLQKKEKYKKLLKNEAAVSEEFIQSKMIKELA